MRGKGLAIPNSNVTTRITPAYAGKRYVCMGHSCLARDHPRVCGEKVANTAKSAVTTGSPPRMRGKVF